MGKNTPGKQKTVRLSEEELKELCQKAVEDGVSKYITVQNQKKKQEWRGLLFRTKKLLENYTKLKDYAEQAVVTLEQAEAEGQPVQDIVEAAMNGAEVRAEVNGPEIIITAEDGAETAESTKPEEAPQEYSMALYYHVTGEQRKALVTAVSAFVDAPAVYQNAPTFAYAIGEYSVDKEGTLTGPASEALITALQAKGFIVE